MNKDSQLHNEQDEVTKDRRDFLKNSAVVAGVGIASMMPGSVEAAEHVVKTEAEGTAEVKNVIGRPSTYPRTFSHIGISVPDVEKAAKFYSEVMGWYHIMEPTVIKEESNTPIGQMCIDVFGKGWGSFKIAHMSTGDKIGIEMFEFKNNETPKDFEYWKTSTFHFCVQDPDIEGLVAKIVEHGGKQRMPIREYYPGEKPYRMCYVEDPFGLIFEVYSHSYELTYSQGAY